MDSKPWYLSKTVWVNIITTLIAVLTLLTEGTLLPAGALPWVLSVVGVLNVVLRIWFTDTAIE